MRALGPYLKALAAVAMGGLAVAKVHLGDDVLTAAEWVDIAEGALTAGAVVWGIPNLPKGGRHAASGE